MLGKIKQFLKAYIPQYKLPAWPADRGYDLVLPLQAESAEGFPLVIAIHGYTHDGPKMKNLSSPNGDPEHPDSLDSLARLEGFAIAYPNGTKISILPGRCWNAGGGINGYAPVGDPALRKGVDDMKYFRDLLEDVQKQAHIDLNRVYLLGISNGGAMVHRLAMTYPEKWAAVATIAACNQHAAAGGVRPKAAVPFLSIHGTLDPIWPFDGGPLGQAGLMASTHETLSLWLESNETSTLEESVLATADSEDECEVHLSQYRGNSARQDIDVYKITGGGHAWPKGNRYLPKAVIGFTTDKLDSNKVIWEFFRNHSL